MAPEEGSPAGGNQRGKKRVSFIDENGVDTTLFLNEASDTPNQKPPAQEQNPNKQNSKQDAGNQNSKQDASKQNSKSKEPEQTEKKSEETKTQTPAPVAPTPPAPTAPDNTQQRGQQATGHTGHPPMANNPKPHIPLPITRYATMSSGDAVYDPNTGRKYWIRPSRSKGIFNPCRVPEKKPYAIPSFETRFCPQRRVEIRQKVRETRDPGPFAAYPQDGHSIALQHDRFVPNSQYLYELVDPQMVAARQAAKQNAQVNNAPPAAAQQQSAAAAPTQGSSTAHPTQPPSAVPPQPPAPSMYPPQAAPATPPQALPPAQPTSAAQTSNQSQYHAAQQASGPANAGAPLQTQPQFQSTAPVSVPVQVPMAPTHMPYAQPPAWPPGFSPSQWGGPPQMYSTPVAAPYGLPFGAPPFGASPFGVLPFGAPPFGAGPYGQPPMGPPFGPSPYGQPPWMRFQPNAVPAKASSAMKSDKPGKDEKADKRSTSSKNGKSATEKSKSKSSSDAKDYNQDRERSSSGKFKAAEKTTVAVIGKEAKPDGGSKSSKKSTSQSKKTAKEPDSESKKLRDDIALPAIDLDTESDSGTKSSSGSHASSASQRASSKTSTASSSHGANERGHAKTIAAEKEEVVQEVVKSARTAKSTSHKEESNSTQSPAMESHHTRTTRQPAMEPIMEAVFEEECVVKTSETQKGSHQSKSKQRNEAAPVEGAVSESQHTRKTRRSATEPIAEAIFEEERVVKTSEGKTGSHQSRSKKEIEVTRVAEVVNPKQAKSSYRSKTSALPSPRVMDTIAEAMYGEERVVKTSEVNAGSRQSKLKKNVEVARMEKIVIPEQAESARRSKSSGVPTASNAKKIEVTRVEVVVASRKANSSRRSKPSASHPASVIEVIPAGSTHSHHTAKWSQPMPEEAVPGAVVVLSKSSRSKSRHSSHRSRVNNDQAASQKSGWSRASSPAAESRASKSKNHHSRASAAQPAPEKIGSSKASSAKPGANRISEVKVIEKEIIEKKSSKGTERVEKVIENKTTKVSKHDVPPRTSYTRYGGSDLTLASLRSSAGKDGTVSKANSATKSSKHTASSVNGRVVEVVPAGFVASSCKHTARSGHGWNQENNAAAPWGEQAAPTEVWGLPSKPISPHDSVSQVGPSRRGSQQSKSSSQKSQQASRHGVSPTRGQLVRSLQRHASGIGDSATAMRKRTHASNRADDSQGSENETETIQRSNTSEYRQVGQTPRPKRISVAVSEHRRYQYVEDYPNKAAGGETWSEFRGLVPGRYS